MILESMVARQLVGLEGPLPSDIGLPCNICIEIDKLRWKLSRFHKGNKQYPHWASHIIKQIEKGLKNQIFELGQSHPKCPKCQLLFGGEHLGEKTDLGICQYCHREHLKAQDRRC